MTSTRRLLRITLLVGLAAFAAPWPAWAYRESRASTPGSADVAISEEMQLELAETLPLGPDLEGRGGYQNFEPTHKPLDRNHANDQWSLMPEGLIYRPYLASAKESRFRSVWSNDRGEGNIWDITLGGQVGILRYGGEQNGRPVGWQLGIEGAGLVRLDQDEDRDVMASDFRFGIPVTWGNAFYQVKLGYYHLSSHLGDEFLLKNPGFPRLNFSRDAFVLGISLSPWELWRVYGEAGYAFYSDVSEQWEFQFGIDYAPRGATGPRGKPFAAMNGHLREEVDFGGNVVLQAGWAWRGSASSGMLRTGVEYYNGKNDQFSFFNVSEQKVGFGIWYDY